MRQQKKIRMIGWQRGRIFYVLLNMDEQQDNCVDKIIDESTGEDKDEEVASS